jgi:hypothetical protein
MNNIEYNRSYTMLFHRQSKIRRLLFATTLLLGFSSISQAQENNPENAVAQPATDSGSVARAVFTSQIVDREPVDSLSELSNDSDRIYFFTDLRELAGQIVTHKWEHDGQVMAEIKFKVGNGPRWRVYSSKNLLPTWTGQWTVSVVDEHGSTLNVSTFSYVAATSTEAATPTEQKEN